MYLKRNMSAGFTLIETIVAITLLVLAITGPMSLSQQSLRLSRDARAELEATHLAEEGIEIVHSIRDNNSGDDATADRSLWMNGILSECASGCVPDVTAHTGPNPNNVWGNNSLSDCSGGGGCVGSMPIYRNTTSGIYRQRLNGFGGNNAWEKTGFTRKITVTNVIPGRQVRVTSEVTYQSVSGATRTITVNGDLYNWFPGLN
jgi:type II secretory pathway pseudopilin PulG